MKRFRFSSLLLVIVRASPVTSCSVSAVPTRLRSPMPNSPAM